MYGIAIHGGAGTILRSKMTEEDEKKYRKALQDALNAGYSVLEKKGTALDAVTAAVEALENNPLFNAGKGSVFNHEGRHEMDASVMTGQLQAGAVACVKNIKNPVLAARAVMEKSEHVFLIGKGAEEFAGMHGIAFEDDDYFHTEHRYMQWQHALENDKVQLDHSHPDKKFGTVGAVALDSDNTLAAATSTGGMTNKKHNRIGDSPLIGAGTYANNQTCAVSCTGHGEFFIRAVAAYDVSCLMEYKSMSLNEACEFLVNQKLKKAGGEGGLIAIDANGNISMPFNSEGMYRAFRKSSGETGIFIYKD